MALTPCYRVPELTSRHVTLARSVIVACCALLASLTASTILSNRDDSPRAFVGVLKTQPPNGRSPLVARRVNVNGKYAKPLWVKDLKEKSDEELHKVIEEARERIFNHRLEAFRKRVPPPEGKYKYQYRISYAKTLLKQREIDENAKAAAVAAEGKEQEPQKVQVWSDLMTEEEQENAFKQHSFRAGHGYQKKSRPRKMKHFSPESAEWAKKKGYLEAHAEASAWKGTLTGAPGFSVAFVGCSLARLLGGRRG